MNNYFLKSDLLKLSDFRFIGDFDYNDFNYDNLKFNIRDFFGIDLIINREIYLSSHGI